MRFCRAILFFFFGMFFAIPASSFAQDSTLPLLHIFCSELDHHYRTRQELPLADEEWRDLVNRLERREAPVADAANPSARLDDCLREHRQEFERAEFILRGKELLADTIRDFKKSPEVSAAAPSETAAMGVPGMGDFYLALPQLADMMPSEWLAETKARQGHYNELWHGFLEELRNELARAPNMSRHTADSNN